MQMQDDIFISYPTALGKLFSLSSPKVLKKQPIVHHKKATF